MYVRVSTSFMHIYLYCHGYTISDTGTACLQPPTMSDGCPVEDFESFEKMNKARAALAAAEDAQVRRADCCTSIGEVMLCYFLFSFFA